MSSFKSQSVVLLLGVLMAACKGSGGGTSPDATNEPKAAIKPADILAHDVFTASLNTSILFLTIVKDGGIPVKASLNIKGGTLDLSGKSTPALALEIDLESFDSALPLRNERVRTLFFNSDKKEMSTAVFKIDALPDGIAKKLRDGQGLVDEEISGTLSFHGQTKSVTAKLTASVTPAGRLAIKSSSAVEIKISDWSLADNLKTMMQVCSHNSIDDLVKMDVSVEFDVKK